MTATVCGKKYRINADPLVVGDDIVLSLEGWAYLRLLNTKIEDMVVEGDTNTIIKLHTAVGYGHFMNPTNEPHLVFAHYCKEMLSHYSVSHYSPKFYDISSV